LDVGGVGGGLGHLLPVAPDRVVLAVDVAPPVFTRELGEVRGVEGRRFVGRVVPGENEAVALHHRIGADAGPPVGALAVGDVDVGALGVEGPVVQGADDPVAVDRAAVTEVGAEVGTEGVHHVGGPGVVSPGDQVAPEVVAGNRLAGRQLVGPGDLEPPERHGHRVAPVFLHPPHIVLL
jgi:hypothetical protein